MSLNFGQFPTPTIPINNGDFVVGYQLLGTGGMPTLAQYTMLQLAGVLGPIIGTLPPSGPAGGDLSGTYPNPTVSAVHATSGTVLGVTGSTQGRLDNSTLLATDAFVNQQNASAVATVPFVGVTGGIYNQATLGTGCVVVVFAVGGVITSSLTISNPGSGYAVGDLLAVPAGNSDAVLRVTGVSGGGVTSVGIAYGGTGYTTGAVATAMAVPPGRRAVILSGVLTSNLTFIIQNGTFLTASREVEFANNTTGAFTITVKLSNGAGGTVGTGVVLPQGTNNSTALSVYTDGVNDVWLANSPTGIGAAPIGGQGVPGRLLAVTVFTNTGTWTPNVQTKSWRARGCGSGGGSGGAAATGAATSAVGGGGASGSPFEHYSTVVPSAQTVTIGAAGTAGAAGANNGGNGGAVSIGAIVNAPGGLGGLGGAAASVATPILGGSGGGVSTGASDFNGNGTPGGFGIAGLGGGNVSGAGGASIFGGGANSVSGTSAGVAATSPGAGASGASAGVSQAAQAGAVGGKGLVIIEEWS